MYQALYRKWRPQTFDQVIGQKHITETLKNQVKTGRLSHAYIFIGTRGTGKTTCARILAKAVNCENPVNGNPCGHCPACLGISQGSVMDVVELDAASNNGVDNVRALREEAVFSPADVKKRVYIIDEVHMLSTSAFNALLKILEEPPEHLMFILATTELHKVPATILSRCQRHIFHRIDTPVIADYLLEVAGKENFNLSPQAAELIARLADGGVRDALSLLDQCSAAENIDVDAVYSAMGLAGNRRIVQMLRNIIRHDSLEALKEFNEMWMDGKDPATFLTELSNLMRDILMLQVAPKGAVELISGAYDTEALREFADYMTREELLCALNTVQASMTGLRESKNPKTAVELCLISLCDNTMADSVSSLKARISRLERQLRDGVPVREIKVPAREISVPAEEKTHFDTHSFETGSVVEKKPAYEAIPYEPEKKELYTENVAEPIIPEPEGYEMPERYEPADRYDDAEDEINFAAFDEEQPEDAFPEHGSRGANQQLSDESVESMFEQPDDEFVWAEICKKVKGIGMDVKPSLMDSRKVHAYLEGDILHIDVIPGFLHKRFEKQEMLERFAKTGREILGRELRVKLGDLIERERAAHSIEELKEYPEVRFI